MKRIALVLALSAAVAALGPGPAGAGVATSDVYRSHFVALDRDGRAYSVDAIVEDRPGGAQLVLEVKRRCDACRSIRYVKALDPGELTVRYQSWGVECQCFTASVETKFGGKPLRIDWVWDPEQGRAGDGFEWTAVTANNLMNVACFGSGTYASTPDPFGDAPAAPEAARDFPRKMPEDFRRDRFRVPGCHTQAP